MQKRTLALLPALLTASLLAGELQAPLAGYIRAKNHRLRAIYGVSGTLIPGPQLPFEDVTASSFSNEGGIVLTGNQLTVTDRNGAEIASFAAGSSDGAVAFSSTEKLGAAWLPEQSKLIEWDGRQFVSSEIAPGGSVLDLQVRTGGAVDLLVRIDDSTVNQTRVAHTAQSISTVRTFSGVPGSALLQQEQPVYQSGTELLIGTQRILTLSEPDLILEHAGEGWIHLISRSTQREWMLSVQGGGAVLSEIPASSGISSTR